MLLLVLGTPPQFCNNNSLSLSGERLASALGVVPAAMMTGLPITPSMVHVFVLAA